MFVCCRFRVSGFKFRVPSFGFQVPSFRSQVSGLKLASPQAMVSLFEPVLLRMMGLSSFIGTQILVICGKSLILKSKNATKAQSHKGNIKRNCLFYGSL